MKFGSLFSGIGGFDLGFEKAGMTCAWQCEIDKQATEVLDKRFGVQIYDDVRKVDNTVEPVDVLCGGFPCQDVSIAGRRAGLAGERSGLWFEFVRVIEELKPGWVVIENVPGLLSSNKGQDFAVILHGLVELGYGVSWRIFDAQFFGVAQRRRRVFIVGSLGNGRSAEVLFEPEGVRWYPPSRQQAREENSRVSGTLAASGSGLDRPSGNGNQLDFCIPVPETVGTLNAADHSATDQVVHSGQIVPIEKPFAVTFCDKNGRAASRPLGGCYISETDKSNTLATSGDGGVLLAKALTTCNQRNDLETETFVPEIASVLRGGGDGGVPSSRGENIVGALQARDYKGVGNQYVNEGKVISHAWTLRSGKEGGGKGYLGNEDQAMTLGGQQQYIGVRRLTPVECARLQGFPDDWNFWLPDTARYKQYGNAVAVPVAEWIGRRIIAVHGGSHEG